MCLKTEAFPREVDMKHMYSDHLILLLNRAGNLNAASSGSTLLETARFSSRGI